MIEYQGAFTVGKDGTYDFRLHSDDGSYLFIDGTMVIDNDGKHKPTSRSGSIPLQIGLHQLKLLYAQTTDRMALQLFVRVPGTFFEKLFMLANLARVMVLKRRVDLLVVGHVTRDEIAGSVRLGGAASYAARAAACLGYDTALVTVAPPDDPLLEPLRRAPRLSLHCVPSEVMTTFALAYAAGQRQLWLRRRARPLVLDDIPPEWRRPRVAYVGPVAGECDRPFAHGLGALFMGAGIQGWLRHIGEDGRIEPALLAETP